LQRDDRRSGGESSEDVSICNLDDSDSDHDELVAYMALSGRGIRKKGKGSGIRPSPPPSTPTHSPDLPREFDQYIYVLGMPYYEMVEDADQICDAYLLRPGVVRTDVDETSCMEYEDFADHVLPQLCREDVLQIQARMTADTFRLKTAHQRFSDWINTLDEFIHILQHGSFL
jgi:hypothetical protein